MGDRERHFTIQLRQTGNSVDCPQVVLALQEGLLCAMDRVLTTTPNLYDQDRLCFTLSSNRLTSNFNGWGLRAGEWRQGGLRVNALLERLGKALKSNEQFEMDDSFQLSIMQLHHAPQGSGKHHAVRHLEISSLNVSIGTKRQSSASKMTMTCAVLAPWSPPKPRWTVIPNGTPSDREEKSKKSEPCYFIKKPTSLWGLVGTNS